MPGDLHRSSSQSSSGGLNAHWCICFQMVDDLRSASSVSSLSPELLFRRVHSRKKIFLLSKKLASLVKTCYKMASARSSARWSGGHSAGGDKCLQAASRTSDMRRQVHGLLSSKIKWVHAGTTVLVKHCETASGADQEFGAGGWRVAQVRVQKQVSR